MSLGDAEQQAGRQRSRWPDWRRALIRCGPRLPILPATPTSARHKLSRSAPPTVSITALPFVVGGNAQVVVTASDVNPMTQVAIDVALDGSPTFAGSGDIGQTVQTITLVNNQPTTITLATASVAVSVVIPGARSCVRFRGQPGNQQRGDHARPATRQRGAHRPCHRHGRRVHRDGDGDGGQGQRLCVDGVPRRLYRQWAVPAVCE